MKRILISLIVLRLLSACSSNVPVLTPTSTDTLLPTQTPVPTATATPHPTATPKPIKEYKNCTPEKFRDCYVPWQDLIPENPNELSDYARWFKSQDWNTIHPIDISKIKTNIPLEVFRGAIIYNTKTAPNFRDPTTCPQLRLSFFTTEKDGITYIGNGVQIVVPGVDRKNYPVIVGVAAENLGYGYSYITGPQGKYFGAWGDKITTDWYMKQTNFPTWMADSDGSPIIKAMFARDPSMSDRINRFVAGDMYALDGVVMPLGFRYWPGYSNYQK